MACVDPLEYDASYYSLLERLRGLPRGRYCARQLEWEDYCAERAQEVVMLARRRPDDTHLFAFCTLDAAEMHAVVRRSSASDAVDATLIQGERVLCDLVGAFASDAAEALAVAARGYRDERRARALTHLQIGATQRPAGCAGPCPQARRP